MFWLYAVSRVIIVEIEKKGSNQALDSSFFYPLQKKWFVENFKTGAVICSSEK